MARAILAAAPRLTVNIDLPILNADGSDLDAHKSCYPFIKVFSMDVVECNNTVENELPLQLLPQFIGCERKVRIRVPGR
jgi:hypothetical protein